jgi:small subunit ribosomal protein S18
MMPRKWRKGDVYAPKDLSHVEAKRWRYSNPPAVDIVDMMGFNPVDNYRVCFLPVFLRSAGAV